MANNNSNGRISAQAEIKKNGFAVCEINEPFVAF